jgi:folate-binding protein YgfZ
MLHDVFVWTHSDLHHQKEMIGAKGAGEWACYIEVDEAETSTLVKHLKRHRLRSKVDIRLVDEGQEAQVCAIWGGNEALEAVSGQFQVLAKLEDPRFVFPRTSQDTSDCKNMVRALVRPTDAPTQSSGHPEEYTRLRYTYGVIEGGEIPKETLPSNKGNSLPMEYNVDISQGIDFKKGCYVGQELTIRTKHTGVVRKRILPVALFHANAPLHEPHSSDQIPTLATDSHLDPSRFESADIKQLDDTGKIKKGRATGKLISVAGNLGLALCRLEMMTPMKVSAEGGSWKPGVEFGIEDGEGEVVRVRPFLRDEWVARVRDMWDKKRERI